MQENRRVVPFSRLSSCPAWHKQTHTHPVIPCPEAVRIHSDRIHSLPHQGKDSIKAQFIHDCKTILIWLCWCHTHFHPFERSSASKTVKSAKTLKIFLGFHDLFLSAPPAKLIKPLASRNRTSVLLKVQAYGEGTEQVALRTMSGFPANPERDVCDNISHGHLRRASPGISLTLVRGE